MIDPPAEIFDVEQGTPEWHELRRGLPTASEFGTIIAKGRDGGASKTRRAYLLTLAAEVITGQVAPGYRNAHMDRGTAEEPEARDLYRFLQDEPVTQVGFIRRGRAGSSPDSLVGDVGLLEIKSALPHLLIDKLDRAKFPSEHLAQCQGQLWISGREWCDLAVYSSAPNMPLFIKRTYRDDLFIAKLRRAVAEFNAELDELVEKVRRYGDPSTLQADLARSLQELEPA